MKHLTTILAAVLCAVCLSGCDDNFMYYAIPCSKDDKRPGCISAIFVEFATSSNDIREAILSDCELRWRFDKRYPKEDEI